jgi:hypothetical protein
MRTLPDEERAIRQLNHFDVLSLRPYLLHLKEEELGFLHCEGCGETEERFEFHHKRYGLYVTFKDLTLLCEECHQEVTASMV